VKTDDMKYGKHSQMYLTMTVTLAHSKELTWTTVVSVEIIAQQSIPCSVDESHSDGK